MTDTAILILNWNNAADTIMCLSSVISLGEHLVILWDNNSSDRSVLQLKEYLMQNDISFAEIPENVTLTELPGGKRVVLIQGSQNLGYAGGNNRMLEIASALGFINYAWLLNNDVSVDSQALQAMKRKMEEDSMTAFVGSATLDYFNRNLVQCCGVRYYRYFGVGKLQYKNREWSSINKKEVLNNAIDYQNGASLLVRINVLRHFGLMDERFFLYSEEHDWQFRAAQKGYNNVLAVDSIIYHKGSVSTEGRRHMFFYYYNNSAIFFSRKHFSLFVTLVASFMLTGITVVRAKFNPQKTGWGIKGIIDGWSKSLR